MLCMGDGRIAMNELKMKRGDVREFTLRNGKPSLLVSVLKKAGAGFEREFDLDSYKRFFADGGYDNVEYHPVYGTVPCVVAILHKN